MSNYRDLLAVDPTRLDAVEELVGRLMKRGPDIAGKYLEAARNFSEERHLNIVFWQALSDLYISARALSPAEIEQNLSVLFRSFQRQGPRIVLHRKRHGRLFKRSDFVDSLMRVRGKITLPRTKAEDKVDRLTRASASQAARMLQFKELGRFLMWSTYCEICDCRDPFHPKAEAAELVDDLGLPFKSGDQFLAFIYELPTPVERFTPTIADAYSGNFFFPFRVGGRTNPIRYQDKLSGRPEVVHSTITGRYLKEPVRILEPDDSVI